MSRVVLPRSLVVKRAVRGVLGERPYSALAKATWRMGAGAARWLEGSLVMDNGKLQYFIVGGGYRTRLLTMLAWARNSARRALGAEPVYADYDVEYYVGGRCIKRQRHSRVPFDGVFEIDTAVDLPELAAGPVVTGVVSARLVSIEHDRGEPIGLEQLTQVQAANRFGETVWINEHSGSISTTHVRLACIRPWPFQDHVDKWRELRLRLVRRGRGARRNGLTAGSTVVMLGDDLRTSLIIMSGPVPVRAGDIEVELRSADGRIRLARLGRYAAFSVIEEQVESVFPGGREFLGGQAGHLIVRSFPPLMNVPGFFVRNEHVPTGQFGIDHSGWVNDGGDTGRGARRWPSRQVRERFEKGHTFVYGVLEDDRTETHVALFNNLDSAAAKALWLQVYDARGTALLAEDHRVDLPKRGHTTIRVRDLIPSERFRLPLVGYFEAGYRHDEMPGSGIAELHGEVLYRCGSAWEGVQGGAHLWNAPTGFVWPEQGEGPRPLPPYPFWAPFIDDESIETYVMIVNNSFSRRYDRPVEFELTVQAASGAHIAGARRTVLPRAVLFEDVRSLASTGDTRRLGTGLIRIRAADPADAKCPAQYFYRHRKSGRWATEHTRA